MWGTGTSAAGDQLLRPVKDPESLFSPTLPPCPPVPSSFKGVGGTQ